MRSSALTPLRTVAVSTLVFWALLGAASAGTQHSTKLGSNDSGQPLEWGPKQQGVRASLSARDKEFSLGMPMFFRVVVENLGRRAVYFPKFAECLVSIERSDGTNAPCVVSPVQAGFPKIVVLNPGERTVLIEGFDIADQYLVASPGTYKIQFTGYGPIPASNTITIRADGPVKPSRLVARKLFDAAQASGWHLEYLKEGNVVPVGRSSVNGVLLAFSHHGVQLKEDSQRAAVWVTTSPSAITPPKLDEKHWNPAEALGRCPWGDVYLWSADASPEELSTVRKLTAAALEIDER